MQKIFIVLLFIWACFCQKNALSLPLDTLEGFLLSYEDFLSEDIARIQHRISENLDNKKDCLETNKKLMESFHLKTIETLDRLEAIKQKDPSTQQKEIDTLLQELLLERLGRLKARVGEIIQTLGQKKTIISVNPLYSRCSDPSNPAYLVILDSAKIDWQFHQLFIKHVFLTVEDPSSLSVKTKTLLQLSPSLWDLLTYKTYDVGDPDQAGGYAAFWWLQNHLEPIEYLTSVKENPIGTSAYLYKRIVIDHALSFDPEQTRVYKNILRTLDGELYRAYTDRYIEQHEENFMLGAKNQKLTIMKTPIEAGVWGEDLLQEPDWLFKRKDTAVKTEALSPASAEDIKIPKKGKKESSCSSGTKTPQRDREEGYTPASTEIRTIGEKDRTMPLQEPVPLPKKDAFSANPLSQASVLDQIEASSTPKEQPMKKPIAEAFAQEVPQKASPPRSVGKEFVFPRGIRLFHPESTKQAIPTLYHPDRKVQDFVNALFDPAQLSHISYSDFQHYWERLGGKIVENRGGSHRQLIAPDTKPLWGIFDHGGFGKKTIGYLQAAFWLQGYKPE